MLKEKLVFNEFGNEDVASRLVIGGETTGIANLNSVKYQWATKSFRIMQNNFWIPEKVSLVEDKTTLKDLTKDELEAFKDTLSFLIALDSMQVANLPRLEAYITAPEISALFTIQAYQELVHSQSYQYILQELFPNLDREAIYNRWRDNPVLLKRNKSISEKYQKFCDNPTEDNFKLALAADFALEGIYFYNGFNYFYQLASRNKGVGTSKIIKYIDTDEATHLNFISSLIREVFDFNKESDKQLVIDVLLEAAEDEIAWAKYVYGDRILGISERSSEEYIKYLTNQRAKVLGLGVLYRGFNKNPYAHLDAEKRENFFETTVTEYSQSGSVNGWDDF
jgi:ribonucleoside-diphosphate reductase beta chain